MITHLPMSSGMLPLAFAVLLLAVVLSWFAVRPDVNLRRRFKIPAGILLAFGLAGMLAACSSAQVASFNTKLVSFNASVVKVVQSANQTAAKALILGCQYDQKFVPIGLDAAPKIAAATGIGLTIATGGDPSVGITVSSAITSAASFDALQVHPAVQAVCAGLLGAGATVAGVPVPTMPPNTTPVPAPAALPAPAAPAPAAASS